jgi:hypothetical protein
MLMTIAREVLVMAKGQEKPEKTNKKKLTIKEKKQKKKEKLLRKATML